MAKHPVIKNLLGFFLLVLFGFSMMPKKTLHDLFATHKDRFFSINDSEAKQIGWAGFHCNCENLVVESPFIGNQFFPSVHFLPSYRILHIAHLAGLASPHPANRTLRGPPLA